jgi:hypothetical protein
MLYEQTLRMPSMHSQGWQHDGASEQTVAHQVQAKTNAAVCCMFAVGFPFDNTALLQHCCLADA